MRFYGILKFVANRMTQSLEREDAPVEEAGKLFFAPKTPQSEKAALLAYLIEEKRFTQLYALFTCANLNAQVLPPLAPGESLSFEGRYFYLFVDCAKVCGLTDESVAAVAFAALNAGAASTLRAWRDAATGYLKQLGYADYNLAWDCFCRYDQLRHADILLEVDRDRTLRALLNAAVVGKGARKTAIRGILRGYKTEVYEFVRANYAKLKTGERKAAVRLLLPLRHDAAVGELLAEIARQESASSVLKLLSDAEKSSAQILSDADKEKAACRALSPEQATTYLYKAMVNGTDFSREFFLSTIMHPPFTASESLFFSVYSGKMLVDIVMVDKGRILNLRNEPTELPENCTVRVLHPVELTHVTSYLKRLNIEQPFAQIHRPVYTPSAADRRANGCPSVTGTIVTLRAFNKNRRRLGFKILRRDQDGLCTQVGLSRGGILCAVTLSPIDLTHAPLDAFVKAQAVWFYDEKQVVRMGGKTLTDGVPPLQISDMSPRTFSEFMASFYALMARD